MTFEQWLTLVSRIFIIVILVLAGTNFARLNNNILHTEMQTCAQIKWSQRLAPLEANVPRNPAVYHARRLAAFNLYMEDLRTNRCD